MIAVRLAVAMNDLMQHRNRQPPLDGRDDHRRDDGERSRFRHGRPARVDRAHDDAEDDDRPGQILESQNALAPRHACFALARKVRPREADAGDDRHEQKGQDQARQHGGRIELAHRGVGQGREDDEGDAGRNEVAQRCAGGDRAQHEALVVVALPERGQRHGRNGRGGRDGRTRDCREDRRRADVRMQQSAGQAIEPRRNGSVHLVGHAAADEYFAEQDVERDRQEDVVLHRAPELAAIDGQMHAFEVDQNGGDRSEKQGGRDMQPEEQQGDHDEEARDDNGDADHGRASLPVGGNVPCVSMSICSLMDGGP